MKFNLCTVVVADHARLPEWICKRQAVHFEQFVAV